MVLEDMGGAVRRADSIIRGLMEFSSHTKRDVKDEDLTAIVDQALLAVQHELANHPVRLEKDLAENLPLLRFDARTIKHVFINLLLYSIRTMSQGGRLAVRTFTRPWAESPEGNGKTNVFKAGETVVGAEVEHLYYEEGSPEPQLPHPTNGLGLTVLKKIIELYGGMIQVVSRKSGGSKYTIFFKPQTKQAI
jgi:signal transduction histidine kinase